MMLSAVLRNS